MPFNNAKINSIISSKAFQKDCLPLLSFVSEVCELSVSILSYPETNQATIIAKKINNSIFYEELFQSFIAQFIFDKGIKIESESDLQIGIPIVLGDDKANAILYFWDSTPKKLNSIQLKTIKHTASQIENLFLLHNLKLDAEKKEFYKKILDQLPTEIGVFDSDHSCLYLNAAAKQNCSIKECTNNIDDFEYPLKNDTNLPLTQEIKNQFIAATKTNSNIEWVEEIKKSNDNTAYYNRKLTPIFNSNGTVEMTLFFGLDITAQKKTEADLRISNENLSWINQATSDALWDWNILNDTVIIGGSYTTLFGHQFKNNTIPASEFKKYVHAEDRERFLQKYLETLNKKDLKWTDEYRYIKSDGKYAYINHKAFIIRDANGKAIRIIGSMEDVSERKYLEEQNRLLIEEKNRNKNIQLNEAKNMYRLLADNTVDIVCLHNLDTSFEYISPSISKLMGYTPEELIGEFPMTFVHPKDIELIQNSFSNFISEVEDENAYIEARFRNKKGEYVWFEIKATVVKDNGNPISLQSSARNITQQKEVQYAMKKALAQERELNELKTNLVSTISHEFRTPMTTIRTSAELIEMYIHGHDFVHSAQLQKRINTITEEIDRIVELMNAVLTISKEEAGKTNFNPMSFDLKQICLDVIETSNLHLMGGRKVRTIFKGKNFGIFADKNLIEYSLYNLLNNAFKYSEETSDIIFKLTSQNSKLEIQIIDFGIGIPEKDIPKLFNTFFRASNTEGIQGTGLGLYIVKTFTERNSGTIHVKSELGKGTIVTLIFPLLMN